MVSGIAGANYVMNAIQNGTAPWHFVEIMCCPGGCVNGGGQPTQPASVRNTVAVSYTHLQVLEGVPLDTPEVMEWIEGSLEEQERALENT